MLVEISKKDAVKNQIETAIFLYFHEKDICSIHTLACASHEILYGLCGEKDIESFMLNTLTEFISTKKGIKIGEARAHLNKPRNFLKHLQSPKKILEFGTGITNFWLYDACSMYKKIFGEHTSDMEIFAIWFKVTNPDLLKDEDLKVAAFEWQNAFKPRLEYYKVMKEMKIPTSDDLKFFLEQ